MTATPTLTREQIAQMPAGPELDAEIARRVFGECGHEVFYYAKDRLRDECSYEDYRTYRCRRCKVALRGLRYHPGKIIAKPYSTDIAAAWLVVEKMRERGWYLDVRDIASPIGRLTRLSFSKHDGLYVESTGDDNARSVCEAALLAVMDESQRAALLATTGDDGDG